MTMQSQKVQLRANSKLPTSYSPTRFGQNPISRRRVMNVVAFRDEKHSIHRSERLVSLAHEFINYWAQGAVHGPTDQMLANLSPIVDTHIHIKSSHPMALNFEAKGLDGLREKLELDHSGQGGSMPPSRAVMCATSDVDDTVFCLLECNDAKSRPQHELRSYAIVKFDTLLDDTACRITGVTERCQLGALDAALLLAIQQEEGIANTLQQEPQKQQEVAAQGTEAQQPDVPLEGAMYAAAAALESSGGAEAAAAAVSALEIEDFNTSKAMLAAAREARQLPGTWHFPTGHVRETVDSAPNEPELCLEAAYVSIKSWCKARSSGGSEIMLLGEALDVESFLLWDGYGVLPSLCGIYPSPDVLSKDKPGDSVEEATTRHCVMAMNPVLDMIRESKAKYKIQCTLLDSAVCSHYNVGFGHWRSDIQEIGGVEDCFIIEGMDVYIFKNDGRISDIWMLRDPMPSEKRLMRAACAKAAPGVPDEPCSPPSTDAATVSQ
ncbi:hypothetical protein CEUSTIGMA_g11303.t1 [Chlamydomonas eustigma]|uniref:Uncharacterized protein n=1 Tax=Chlamydomonas eustigma TaxID=1157962 RepID=A0A250XLC4_9CHLO|nr:hypothetical protein CEUSTIGMA_g11303.t1 [Chlamydomonas eustigma]|eukprot:GAX83878.1 hypothetical protein CEUSTIGMA_g11303.t1 [Chlamydomonas eustigma]